MGRWSGGQRFTLYDEVRGIANGRVDQHVSGMLDCEWNIRLIPLLILYQLGGLIDP